MKMNRLQMMEYIKLLRRRIKKHEKTIKRHEVALGYIQVAQGSIQRVIDHHQMLDRQDKIPDITDTPISPEGSDHSSDDLE